jgi:hypothetical protein
MGLEMRKAADPRTGAGAQGGPARRLSGVVEVAAVSARAGIRREAGMRG